MESAEQAELEKRVARGLLDLHEKRHSPASLDDTIEAVRRLPPFGSWSDADERMMLSLHELTTGSETDGRPLDAAPVERDPILSERLSVCATADGTTAVLAAGFTPDGLPVLTLAAGAGSVLIDSAAGSLGYLAPRLLAVGDTLFACSTRVDADGSEAGMWRIRPGSEPERHWAAPGEVVEAAAATRDAVILVTRSLDDESRMLRLTRIATDGSITAIEAPPAVAEAWQPVIEVREDGELALAWLVDAVDGCRLHYAWTSDGDWRHGAVDADGTTYAVHPNLAWGADAQLYLAFDELSLPGHGSSGTTRYVAPGTAEDDGRGNDLTPQYRATCRAVLCSIDTASGDVTELVGPLADRHRSVAAYPTLAVDGEGTLHLAIARRRALPRLCFLAPIVHAALKDGRWSEPVVIGGITGGYRRPELHAEARGVVIAGIDERFASRYRTAFGFDSTSSDADGTALAYLDGVPLGGPQTGTMIVGNQVGVGIAKVARVEGRTHAITGESSSFTGVRTPDDTDRDAIAPASPDAYWGDLHRHSALSRCAAGLDLEAEDNHYFAKHRLGLTFWALTDHAESLTPHQWRIIRRLTVLNNRTSCLTVPAFEWTSFRFGHLNVFGSTAEHLPSAVSSYSISSPEELWNAFDRQGGNILTLPHHPSALSYATDWSVYTAERIEKYAPVVEIFQAATGSYEEGAGHRQFFDGVRASTVTDALMRKLKLGIIASSDHRYGVSYVGLYRAPADRDDLFEMLRRRECFAGTQRGIVPSLTGSGNTFAVTCSSTVDLASLELVRNGSVVWARHGSDGLSNLEFSIRAQFGGARALDGELRVIDGGRFVHGPTIPPMFLTAEDDVIRWSGTVPANRQGYPAPAAIVAFGLSVEGDATLELRTGDEVHRFTVAEALEMDDATLDFYTAAGLTFAFGPGRGSLVSLGTTSVEERVSLPDSRTDDWLYVRAVSVTGEAAWTSPVWV